MSQPFTPIVADPEPDPDDDNTEAIAAGIAACELERDYFKMGARFLNDNCSLFGYTFTGPTDVAGDVDDDVRSAMNLLAVEVARRMARIMRNDHPATTPRKAADLA